MRYTTILNELEENTDGTNNNKNNDTDGANIKQSPDDDEGASQLLITFYKDRLINCNGILYANNGRIWTGDNNK